MGHHLDVGDQEISSKKHCWHDVDKVSVNNPVFVILVFLLFQGLCVAQRPVNHHCNQVQYWTNFKNQMVNRHQLKPVLVLWVEEKRKRNGHESKHECPVGQKRRYSADAPRCENEADVVGQDCSHYKACGLVPRRAISFEALQFHCQLLGRVQTHFWL